MRNNTIEVKLNSYGTLEVVSLPVKLYKDSYNVIKLRVNAPFKENSMLKVYLGDENEAGEKVWTSKAYSLPKLDRSVTISGVHYNVYEDFLPQEFCAENGDIRITFAQIVGKDGVQEIMTTGALNLYVSGDGFNYNGVEISDYDNLSIKINEVLSYYKDYDLKIKSQAEFEAFYHSLDDGTCTAHSVLFIGDGGDLVFTRQDGKGLLLPSTLYRLDGLNNAKIEILNHAESVNGGIRYETKPTTDNYCISNLTITCKADANFSGVGIANARNIVNCRVYGYALSDGFSGFGLINCDNIFNVESAGDGIYAVGFESCSNLVNCISPEINSKGSVKSFWKCKELLNCNGDRFEECSNMVNCLASSEIRESSDVVNSKITNGSFYQCNRLVNCEANNNFGRPAFRNCNYLTGCIGGDKINTLYDNCTNIVATLEDLEHVAQDADITSDKLLNVLEDSSSIVVSTNADGSKVTLNLDADITNQISKSLVLPMSAPASTKLVAVDDGNSQTMLSIGNGLNLVNGTLNATGTPVQILQTTGSSTSAVMSQNAVTTQINNLSTRIDNISSTGSSVTVVDTLVSQSTTDALSARQGNVLYNMVADAGKEIMKNELSAHKQILIGGNGVLQGNVYNFTIQDANSYIDYRTNLTKFLIDLSLPIGGDLDATKQVAITFGDTTYYVFNILKGSERATIGDLQQVEKYNNATGYRFIAEMTFFQTSDLVGFAIIPTISVSDVLSLNSDQMDDYMADGGLSQGQLAICSKVITNGYDVGALYRFDIRYPNTYTWTKISYSKNEIDNLIGDIESLLSEV